MEFEKFEEKTLNWAKEKSLLKDDELTKSKQLNKLIEETGELSEDFIKCKVSEEHKKHLVDSVGDVLVTLLIFAKQNGLTMEECYDKAWSHIANRTGKTVAGSFTKDEDRD